MNIQRPLSLQFPIEQLHKITPILLKVKLKNYRNLKKLSYTLLHNKTATKHKLFTFSEKDNPFLTVQTSDSVLAPLKKFMFQNIQEIRLLSRIGNFCCHLGFMSHIVGRSIAFLVLWTMVIRVTLKHLLGHVIRLGSETSIEVTAVDSRHKMKRSTSVLSSSGPNLWNISFKFFLFVWLQYCLLTANAR